MAAVIGLALTFTIGCAKKQTIKPEAEVKPAAPAAEPGKPPQETAPDQLAKLQTIYFDFDSYAIREDQKSVLKAAAIALRQNGGIRLRLEGHCDERGTIEYNLALGERRATEVREYLQNLGATTGQLETVSFGEERPADGGHGEESWAKNRRVEFNALP